MKNEEQKSEDKQVLVGGCGNPGEKQVFVEWLRAFKEDKKTFLEEVKRLSNAIKLLKF